MPAAACEQRAERAVHRDQESAEVVGALAYGRPSRRPCCVAATARVLGEDPRRASPTSAAGGGTYDGGLLGDEQHAIRRREARVGEEAQR